ncbi:hypothetical protein NCG89_11720 [Spongiibacter taiwanensis]|uniref:hypothetical protein n=1 Tax=Spongiibacter taiwanensis TaxID=1748242 RepID=UPI00203659A9|nr:hypothetical protein [Spongiibacter taiwanensis]USA42189.1 hypothetical protein NCG89_11720 [Spongiibacter taiwanensis]
MKGEHIYVEHPRDSHSRIGGLHFVYFDIAQDEYVKCLEVEAIDDSGMHEGEKAELSYKATEHAVKAIIFSALCVEAAINNYSGIQLGDSYSEKHLHSMDVISKWVVIPKLVCGQTIDKSGPAFGSLKKLISARNKLVHNKSKEFSPSDPKLAESLEKRDVAFKADFENSLRALYLMCMEMDFLVGQMHNPIRTLDSKFSPFLEIPDKAKPLFNECKKIVLNLHS